jgi:hypothetical protein
MTEGTQARGAAAKGHGVTDHMEIGGRDKLSHHSARVSGSSAGGGEGQGATTATAAGAPAAVAADAGADTRTRVSDAT